MIAIPVDHSGTIVETFKLIMGWRMSVAGKTTGIFAWRISAFSLLVSFCLILAGLQGARATDNFPGETVSGSGSVSRSSVGATAEVGEPTPNGTAAFQPLNTMWYSWTAASAGTLVVQTCSAAGTTFDTVLGAFTGNAVNALTQLAFNDDTAGCAVTVNGGYGSRVTLQVSTGTTYRIQVDGYGAATGTFLLQYAFTPAAITVTTTDASATEGGDTAAFTIALATVPSAATAVAIAADPTGQCTFAPTTLNFTTANSATPQTVTVTAVNDVTPEGVHSCITGAITASGSNYSTVTGTAPTFTVNDNDQGIIIVNTTPTATEGGANGAFTVKLATLPTANVTVTIAADASGQCTFAPTPLTFTTANWNVTQTVTTTAVNDAVVEGTHSCTTGAINAAGGGYAGITGTAPTFSITDNDTGTIIVTNTVPSATEGGATGAFTIALGFQPSASVTVTIAADVTGQCTFAPTTLTFTTANWNTAQPVTTTAVNDVVVEGTHACTTGAIAASGGSYTGVTGTAPTFTITDNDTGAITIVKTIGTATEGGATGAFTVVLTAQPGSNVTVSIGVDATGQCTFAPTPLTFTNANWNVAQSVTTTAVNDTLVEGAHSCTTGSIAAAGSGYTGVTGTSQTFAITDNDTGAITIVKTIGTATEGGATGAFTVVLTAQPGSNVTVSIGVDAAGQCTFAPTPLTFTNANWNVAQTVTTTAVNDLLVEGAHSCTTGTIGGSGSGYTGVNGTSQTFTITDNDTASITLTKNASVASVTNAGNIINYTIQISNTGSGAATAITVTDTLVSVICPTSGTNTIASLAASSSETCTASYTVSQADFDNNGGGDGDIDNSASASGTSGGVPVSASGVKAVLCTQNPSLTLVKTANKAGPLVVGDVITYTFLASNTGNVSMANVSVSETAFNGTAPPLGTPTGEVLTDVAPLGDSTDATVNNGIWTSLKPGDSVKFTINYTVTQNDIDLL